MAESGSVNAVPSVRGVPMEHDLTETDKALIKSGGDLHNVTVHKAYEEYPRHVHKLATDKKSGEARQVIKVVGSDEEKASALAEGWSLEPIPLPSTDDEADEPASAPSSKSKKK